MTRAALNIVDQWQRPVAETVRLDLPFPPSINALWRRGRTGMYRSPTYMTWINAAGTALSLQKPGRIDGNYIIALELERKDNRRRDCDNLIKAVSDLLELHGVIEDDCLCEGLTVAWSPRVSGCRVVLVSAERKKAA